MKLTAENWEKLIRSNPNSGSVAHIWCEEIGGWLAPDEKMLKSFISSLLQAFFEDLAGEIEESGESISYWCPNCRAYVNKNDKYCSNCRKKIVKEIYKYKTEKDNIRNLHRQEVLERGKKWINY